MNCSVKCAYKDEDLCLYEGQRLLCPLVKDYKRSINAVGKDYCQIELPRITRKAVLPDMSKFEVKA